MGKSLHADMDEAAFWRLKGLFGELEASTNDEAIIALMDFYEENKELVEQYNESSSSLENSGDSNGAY